MALSGSFTGTTNNDYVRPKITWSATQSVSGNYSTVKATLSYSRTNTGYTTYGTWSGSLTINGNKATGSKRIEITYNSNTVAIAHTVTVNHDADGTKSITISATGGLPDTSTTSTSISATVTLDTIPRATTPTVSASSVYMGDAVTINTPRASSSFTHDLAYSFADGSYVSIKTGVGTSHSWTTPDLASKIPNATSGTVTIRCITKNGSTTIGTKTVTMTLKVPTSVVPTISAVTTAEATSGLAAQFGAFIRGKSKVKTTITAAGAGGSTIKSYSTTFNGKTYTGSSWTSPVVDNPGTLSLVTTVKDSRGRTAKKTVNIEVLDYSKPVINTFSVYRCNESGTAADDGEYIAVRYKYSAPSLNGGNTVAMAVSYKLTSEAEYTELLTGTALSANTTVYPKSPTFSVDNSYNLRITVVDYFGAEVSSRRQLSTATVILDFGADGKSVGIGKVSELESYFDVKFKTRHRADLDFDNGVRLYAYDSAGNLKQVFSPQTGSNHLAIGYGNYERAEGNTNLCGHDIVHYISNIASPGSYRPYIRQGDSFNVIIRTAGYVTNGGKDVSFFLPLSKPVIGSPTVTAASVDGFTFRQGGKYTHGSTATKPCTPSSYSVTRSQYYGLVITASFTDTTDATNNDVIGIYWSGTVTIS